MRWGVLLWLSVAACPPDSGNDASNQPRDRAAAGAARCSGGSLCHPYGATCRDGDMVCSCASPCRGAEPEEPDDRPVWSCTRRPRACPDQVPKNGERCRRNGLSCGYGTCGGASVTCENGTWAVLEYDPPPSMEQ